MSVKMDAERIAKWKCLMCGSKYKKTVTALQGDSEMGFSVVCCSCGHTDNFVTNFSAIPIYTVGASESRISQIKVACGCSESDENICEQSDCECKKKKIQETTENTPHPQSSIRKVAREIGKNSMLPLSPPDLNARNTTIYN